MTTLVDHVDSFVEGLKSSKNVYVQCPNCQFIFSLYHSRIFNGKSPPKDLLSKSVSQVRITLEQLESFQEKYEGDKEEWKSKIEEKDQHWRYKIDLKYQEYLNKERLFREKLRHIKSDIAAAHKEIIKEKVDKALLSSRSAIEGHIAELFPVFRKTRINPADLCALIPTSPVDFVVFDGLFQKEVSRITFLDVKKGGATLSHTQKSIRDTIEDGKIEFKKIRVNFDNVKGHAEEES